MRIKINKNSVGLKNGCYIHAYNTVPQHNIICHYRTHQRPNKPNSANCDVAPISCEDLFTAERICNGDHLAHGHTEEAVH